MEMFRNDFGDGASQKPQVIATVPNWWPYEKIIEVREYFENETTRFATVVLNYGIIANISLNEIKVWAA